MICPLIELTVCAQGRGVGIMGKFAELGKEYDVIVTRVTANQGLEFEELRASIVKALTSCGRFLEEGRRESQCRERTSSAHFMEEGRRSESKGRTREG